jgi:hypothetical protein
MFFSEDFRRTHDFNRVIEMLGNDNQIIRTIWLINNTVVDTVDFPNDPNRFQFYNIKYIENVFLDILDSIEEPISGDIISVSDRYVRIRSLVRFNTNLVELNDTDITILQTQFRRFGVPEMLEYYNKKVRVYHYSDYYWLFVQTELEQFISGQFATVRYYPIMWNDNLYLVSVGFSTIQ